MRRGSSGSLPGTSVTSDTRRYVQQTEMRSLQHHSRRAPSNVDSSRTAGKHLPITAQRRRRYNFQHFPSRPMSASTSPPVVASEDQVSLWFVWTHLACPSTDVMWHHTTMDISVFFISCFNFSFSLVDENLLNFSFSFSHSSINPKWMRSYWS